MHKEYININKNSWNKRTEIHWNSKFYDNDSFIAGRNSLNDIELNLLGNMKGKSVLHLQCHFGQDTISLTRLGANIALGVDLSDVAIRKAKELANLTKSYAQFICCDLYDLPKNIDEKFDIVFSSYGTIGWLPDMDKWVSVIKNHLKVNGIFVFVEFHPVMWMFNQSFTTIEFDYFKSDSIVDENTGTYTEGDEDLKEKYVSWNHSLGEVISALHNHGFILDYFQEYDYSPYPCFDNVVEIQPNRYKIASLEKRIPMVYALRAQIGR